MLEPSRIAMVAKFELIKLYVPGSSALAGTPCGP